VVTTGVVVVVPSVVAVEPVGSVVEVVVGVVRFAGICEGPG
jgi:hypothetical protein